VHIKKQGTVALHNQRFEQSGPLPRPFRRSRRHIHTSIVKNRENAIRNAV
jgi:hypothetical protein